MNDNLRSYGWSKRLEALFSSLALGDCQPGRVVETQRGMLRLQTEQGSREAVLAGRNFAPEARSETVVVGDWVAFHLPALEGPVVVRDVLERRNTLARKAAGARAVKQVVAANVDLVLLVMGLDDDYNPRRLERFLAVVEQSGAVAAVVLNKSDLCEDLEDKVSEIRALTSDPVVAISALGGDLSPLEILLEPGRTVALMGTSGAGKSTIINRLLGEEALRTQAVRGGDSRGRHTTTHRELFRLPGGALVIDNPGVREIQPWADVGDAVATVFEDIESLARECRFGDCSHTNEPGCAVREAIERGELQPDRLESLRKLEIEAEALERRKDERRRREHDKSLGKLYKSVLREKKNRWR